MTPDALAAAYLQSHRSGADEDFWAFEDVVEACNRLESGLPITLRLIQIAADDAELFYVAAGPVEDLLKWHGEAAIEAFAKEAANSVRVREALAGVWLKATDEAFPRWKMLMDEYFPGAFNWEALNTRSRGALIDGEP